MRLVRKTWLMAVAAWWPWVAVAGEMPGPEKLVSAVVAALPEPRTGDSPGGLRMAVTAATPEVQAHVLDGLSHLLAGWDFEAYRHFCAAVKADPECLMAHWGIGLALAEPGIEFGEQRVTAVERMAGLAKSGHGTELERGYAYGLVVFFREGAGAAGDVFRKLGLRYPNDTLAKLLGALFGRSGYDEFGDPTPDQERAEESVRGLLALQPGNPVLTYTLLMLRAEAPATDADLDQARDMCARVPGVPSYQHLLGHYEWRCGNHARAAVAFGRAAAMLEAWRKQEGMSVADCPDWVKTEAYRAVALASGGDFESALASARSLAAVPLDPKRPGAAGTRMLMWEAKTLPARLLLARHEPGDAAAALESLPKPKSEGAGSKDSSVRWYLQGLALVLETRKAIEAKDLGRARQVSELLTDHGSKMEDSRGQATEYGELSHWVRAFRGLEALAAEVRGDLALAGPVSGRGSAFNWYLAACDRQTRASMMMPPVVLLPERMRLGDMLMGEGKPDEAVEQYRTALKEWPRHLRTLERLKAALEKTGKIDEAAEVDKAIKATRGG